MRFVLNSKKNLEDFFSSPLFGGEGSFIWRQKWNQKAEKKRTLTNNSFKSIKMNQFNNQSFYGFLIYKSH